MDARFIGTPHMKSGAELDHQSDGRCTTIARLFNPSTYQADGGYSGLNQKCLKRNYDDMIGASYGGPGLVMLSDGCFPKPGIPPQPHSLAPHLQQMLFRQPYSIPMGSSLSSSSGGGGEMQHLVQEPKFPPQTFEIPDIQDSNSVFCDGFFDGTAFGNYSSVPSLAPGADRLSFFYGSPVPGHSQCRPVVPSAFPGWQQQQQQQQQQPGVVSSAGSTNSSPVSQAEEATPSSAAEVGASDVVQTPQQVQQGLKINGFSTSHSGVLKLPNKKARSPKRRKRKDPNEPQKPVSAYSLFFRNAQAAIKSQNPSATFGDVSKIVASMWDSLDDDVKNFYKRQMEVAKKEYLKQLAVYRATLVSKQDVQGKTSSEMETGLGTQLSAPSVPPSAPPVHSKAEEGSTAGLRLSPVATSMCMSSPGYPGQMPMSPAPETMSHMMSPPTTHLQTTSPRYYSDGPPQLPGNYSTSSDVTVMRNTFLQYSQKLDHESLLSGIPEHGGYFLGSIPEPGYKSSREYISLENNFRNGPSREMPGRPFVDSEDGPKLT